MLPRIQGVGLVAWLVTLAYVSDFAVAGTFTVDDADPAITYSAGNWNIGNTCTGCYAQPPDRSLINAQTWHDATRGGNSSEIWFQYTFTGTSLTVYGILIDIVRTAYVFTTNVDLTLDIDGQTSRYTYTPVSRESYQYQIPVFSQQGLSNTAHTMRVTLNPSSAFLFDYLVYTTPDTSTSSDSTSASISSIPSISTQASTSTSTSINSPTPSSSSVSSVSSLPALGSLSLSTDTSGSIYTISSGVALPSSGSSTISIVGIVGIVAGVVSLLLIIIAILLFLLFRKRRQSRQNLGPQPLSTPAEMRDDYGVSEPFMQSMGPTAFPNTISSHGASTSQVMLNNMSATTPYGSSGNLNSFNSPIGGTSEATGVASGAAMTMNSKQRRIQEDHALLPAQQPQQHHHVPTSVNGGGGESAYTEGTGSGTSVYGGMANMSSHTGSMTSSSGNTEYHDSSALIRSAAPGVGGRVAPWNTGLYPHGIAALAAPVPVPLGLPLGQNQVESSYSGRGSEARSRSAASGVTRPPTAPPPYIRSPPPPLSATDRGESIGRGLESVSEYNEKR